MPIEGYTREELDGVISRHALLRDLQEIGVLQFFDKKTGHFNFGDGTHGSVFIKTNLLFAGTYKVAGLMHCLLEKTHSHIEGVLGVGENGRHMAAVMSTFIPHSPYRFVSTLWTTEKADGSLEIPEDLARFARGRKILVVQDVVASGRRLAAAVSELKKMGGEPFAAATIWNRSGKKGSEFGTQVDSLVDFPLPNWPAHECPLCKMGNPLSLTHGHSADLMNPGHCGIGARSEAISEALSAPKSDSPWSAEPEPPAHPADDEDFMRRQFDL